MIYNKVRHFFGFSLIMLGTIALPALCVAETAPTQNATAQPAVPLLSNDPKQAPSQTTKPIEVHGRYMPLSFADTAAKLLPAVVNISTTETLKAGSNPDGDDDGMDDGSPNGQGPEMPNFPPGSPFEKFFRDFLNRQQGANPNAAPRRMQALGSGFIIDPSGIIVTNNHVVRHADQITVTLQDNTTLVAKLVGSDERTDLAVLKIEPKTHLSAVSFGDSDSARIGDWVIAIGNPFGLAGTVTTGIVSSRGRNIEQGPYDDFIQTDAPINKGNSGGPLFNMKGEVIGINTAIYSPSGGSIGIGFAIPSNEAKNVIEQLRKNGKVIRGWMGVRIQAVTQDIADSLGLKTASGALIASVEKNGPAEKAHLKSGDVILSLNGKDIQAKDLPRIVAETKVGEIISLGVWRQGKKLVLPLKLTALPEEPENDSTAAKTQKQQPSHSTTMSGLGFSVMELTPELRQKYNIPEQTKGVVVSAITESGSAAERDLRVGDIITQIQQDKVTSVADVNRLIAAAKKEKRKTLLLLIQGADGLRWVPLALESSKK